MKFKIIAGKHREAPSRRVFGVGAIVESEHDLAATFANKFEKVDDSTPTTEAQDAVATLPRQAELEATKTEQRLRGGLETPAPAQDLINSRAGRSGQKTQEDVEEEERQRDEAAAATEATEAEHTATEAKGKDSGLVVRRTGTGTKARYNVYDPDSATPSETLNLKPLKKDEVDGFLKKHTAAK